MNQLDFFGSAGAPDPPVSVARARLFASPAFRSPGGRHLCPCCGQNAKLRNRRLNAGMAASVCWIVRQYEQTQDWIDVQAVAPRFVMRGREWPRTALWGLLEAKPNTDRPEVKDSGLWRPTSLGRRFVYGMERVPSHARVFDAKVLEWSEETMDVHEALEGSRFDYSELTGRVRA